MTNPSRSCPHVYRAISRITAEFATRGIGKSHTNIHDQYQYRSIDDLLNRLAPLLAKHRLCILPQVLERQAKDRTGEAGAILVNVRLLVAFELVSCRDGSRHLVRAWGEALDPGDKGTAKAMSAAYKSAMLQTFCVPVAGEDADAVSHRLRARSREHEPVQGWHAWAEDIVEIIASCETDEALLRLRNRQRALLDALRSERPELYAKVGAAVVSRAAQLGESTAALPEPTRPGKVEASLRSTHSQRETEHAHDAIAATD